MIMIKLKNLLSIIGLTAIITNLSLVTTRVIADSIPQQDLDFSKLNFTGAKRKNIRIAEESRNPNCPDVDKPTMAIVPEYEDFSSTANNTTSIWIYVPYSYRNVQNAEFVVQDENNTKNIYKTQVYLDQTPGIIGIPIPETNLKQMEQNKSYTWAFTIFCTSDVVDNVFVKGYIKKVDFQHPNPKYSDYAYNQIWFDAITLVAEQLRENPDDTQLNKDWRGLLRSEDLDLLVGEPIVECCN